MLNGRVTIEHVDNGWVLQWAESAPSFLPHREVYTDPFECSARLYGLVGLVGGPAAARLLLDFAAARDGVSSSGHVDPATDPDVAALAAPGTPPTVVTGD